MDTGLRVLLVLTCLAPTVCATADDLLSSLPPPEVNADSWVMIEIWPEVKDITLSAYFLDFSDTKNRNLCEATKKVFDRDQEAMSQAQRRKRTSYRMCLPVSDAIARGLIGR